MTDTGNANCRELLDVLIGQGLDTVVLSPGSRNAPQARRSTIMRLPWQRRSIRKYR